MAVFSRQSVIKDPPFTRLDLLSCRNVLILSILHYALRPGGVLCLSPV